MKIGLSDIGIKEKDSTVVNAALRDLCGKYHIRSLKVFGSVLKRTNKPQSDVDLLVKFEPGHTPGFAFARIADELADLLGMTVDLHTEASLSKYFRRQVVQEAQVIYAEEE